MKRYKFVGENGPVDVPALGLIDVEVGRVVEVDSDLTDSFDGSEVWEHIPDPKRSAAAKKAAAANPTPEES